MRYYAISSNGDLYVWHSGKPDGFESQCMKCELKDNCDEMCHAPGWWIMLKESVKTEALKDAAKIGFEKEMNCKSCMFWKEHHTGSETGECRRKSPNYSVYADTGTHICNLWPSVDWYQCCGEWKDKEE